MPDSIFCNAMRSACSRFQVPMCWLLPHNPNVRNSLRYSAHATISQVLPQICALYLVCSVYCWLRVCIHVYVCIQTYISYMSSFGYIIFLWSTRTNRSKFMFVSHVRSPPSRPAMKIQHHFTRACILHSTNVFARVVNPLRSLGALLQYHLCYVCPVCVYHFENLLLDLDLKCIANAFCVLCFKFAYIFVFSLFGFPVAWIEKSQALRESKTFHYRPRIPTHVDPCGIIWVLSA